ncbi:pyridoxal phosphate-dependent aminotransferase [Flavobacterium algicola]|uniref:pyridoxal phosphate-dependent aminotransferase n=1 Tax=Flavobacterium algicola TaxID=556529 RepID=UPI001EFD7D1B|nr:pyridoxal phosphate-dependent aminotransferase [Flavobacterium algicola]MCG9794171.1 pyridoxal phosphate-dependent aminotransferase [Flavobacterium algicola]
MFQNNSIDFDLLKKRAYNLRWATVPQGVIPLTAADPDFKSAPEIAEAISKFAKDRYFCYTPPEGLPEFKESIATYFQERRNVPVQPEFAFPVDSAAFGIYLTCKAFLSIGDEAIIFDPVDFLFRYSIENVGGKAIPFAIPAGTHDLDFTELEKLITKRTKMICLCNPLNPTGKVFTKGELTKLGEIACKYNLIILSDEIWSDIIFKPAVFTSIASINEQIRNQTITITGFSKSYGLAGLRIGAVIAHNQNHFNLLMDVSLHNSTVHGATVLSQVAATAALNECGYYLDNFVTHLTKIRSLIVTELNSIPGFNCVAPEGCYVAFTNITKTNKTSQEIYELLLKEAKVAVVPGLKQWFGEGAEGHIRMSFASSEEVIMEAMNRIKTVIK